MSAQRRRELARLWLSKAQQRLTDARTATAERDNQILCEQAHYAAEMAIKSVIIARGHKFPNVHEVQELLDTAENAGESIPAELIAASIGSGVASVIGVGTTRGRPASVPGANRRCRTAPPSRR